MHRLKHISLATQLIQIRFVMIVMLRDGQPFLSTGVAPCAATASSGMYWSYANVFMPEPSVSLCTAPAPKSLNSTLLPATSNLLVLSKLFLALVNITAKTSPSVVLAFRSRVFLATTDFSSQAGKSVCGHDAHLASSPDAQELGIFYDLCLSTFTTLPAA